MNQRIVVVAPMRESASGATKRLSQDFPGRPSESAKAKTSVRFRATRIAARRFCTFSDVSPSSA